MPEANPKAPNDAAVRNWIAISIVIFGFVFVTIISCLIVWLSTEKERPRAAQLILSSILPLVGTWVGTVLAFYYAKDNFEAASRSTRELVGLTDRLRTIPVVDAMIGLTQITKHVLAENKTPDKVTIEEILTAMGDRNRLPVLDSKNVAKLVVHRSTATGFVTRQAIKVDIKAADIKKLTIADLKKDAADLYAQIGTFVVVPRSASLADAKQAMESIPNCGDVFVTETGKDTEPIIGWITNVEISKRSRAQ